MTKTMRSTMNGKWKKCLSKLRTAIHGLKHAKMTSFVVMVIIFHVQRFTKNKMQTKCLLLLIATAAKQFEADAVMWSVIGITFLILSTSFLLFLCFVIKREKEKKPLFAPLLIIKNPAVKKDQIEMSA